MVLRIFPPLVVSCVWEEKALFTTFSATCGWLFLTGALRPPITSQAMPSASAKRPTPASAAIIPWSDCACLADARRSWICLCAQKRTELWRLFLFGGELGVRFADARGLAVQWGFGSVFFAGFEGVPEFLEDFDVLVVLVEFFLGHLDGGHEFAVRACLLVELGVMVIKLPEFRGAQLRTSFNSNLPY